jgi:hypothetical protein
LFKTQLSNNLVAEKVVIVIVPVIMFFSWAAMPLIIALLVFLLMLMLVPYSIYTIYMAHLNIAFDAAVTFITDRKTERLIPLQDIKAIRPVSNFAALRIRWQITYVENEIEEALYFYPADNFVVEKFIKAVRVKNPRVSAPD